MATDGVTDAQLCTDADTGGFLQSDSLKPAVEREEFPVSVCKFFKLFYADDQMERAMRDGKGITQLVVGDWHPQPPSSGFFRDLTYTQPIHSSLSPVKSANATMHQRYHLTPQRLILEEATSMVGPPYSEYYRVEARVEAVTGRSGPNSCTVTMTSGTYFHKHTMFKSKIDTAVVAECKKAQQEWIAAAHAKAAQHASNPGAPVAAAPAAPHRRRPSNTPVPEPIRPAASAAPPPPMGGYVPPPVPVVPVVTEPPHTVVTLDLDALMPYAIPLSAGLVAIIALIVVLVNDNFRHQAAGIFFSGGSYFLTVMLVVLYLVDQRFTSMQERFEEHLKIIETRLLVAGASHM